MQTAQATLLPDGKRLHLHHGPIDLIIKAWGPGRNAAYTRATRRFETILQELVDELPDLRTPLFAPTKPLGSGFSTRSQDRVPRRLQTPSRSPADRMRTATAPFAAHFITPMAAVAGAVADEILVHLTADPAITKAYVNNGGDIALHLGPGQSLTTDIAATTPARITLTSSDPCRGIATSGWQGRSHSLGIADSVTVLAHTAARADAAATMIANAVDLPGHPAIARAPAHDLQSDSDLGPRLVITAVGPLTPSEGARALDRGADFAHTLLQRGLIAGAALFLNEASRTLGHVALPIGTELCHA